MICVQEYVQIASIFPFEKRQYHLLSQGPCNLDKQKKLICLLSSYTVLLEHLLHTKDSDIELQEVLCCLQLLLQTMLNSLVCGECVSNTQDLKQVVIVTVLKGSDSSFIYHRFVSSCRYIVNHRNVRIFLGGKCVFEKRFRAFLLLSEGFWALVNQVHGCGQIIVENYTASASDIQ